METIGMFAGFALILFASPYLIGLLIYNYLTHKLLGRDLPKYDKDHMGYKVYAVSGVFWLLVAGYMLYQSQFTSIQYVYAYPNYYGSSKAYHVVADYVHEDCEEGSCDPSYVEKIYFNDGGYISFSYCDEHEDTGYMMCMPDDGGDYWLIDFAESVKIKKL